MLITRIKYGFKNKTCISTQLNYNQACCQTNLYVFGFSDNETEKYPPVQSLNDSISTLTTLLVAIQKGDFYDGILSSRFKAGEQWMIWIWSHPN